MTKAKHLHIVMVGLSKTCLFLAAVAMCFVTSCAQQPNTHKLIEEINGGKVKARDLIKKAEEKRKEAGAGDQAQLNKLIQEAAELYKQASNLLSEAAKKADEVSKSKSPEWYQEYFTLQAKLLRNFAQLGVGAHDELLTRLNGPLSEAQERSMKENLSRIGQEDKELQKRINEIESRQGVVLIKE